MENQKPFRVLTIDGGGMRGLYASHLLDTLARRFNNQFEIATPDIGKAFDLICGTSTGAIIGCGLAAGIPIKDISKLFIEHGKGIFPSPQPNGNAGKSRWGVRHSTKPSSDADYLRTTLENCFAKQTLGEVYNKRGIALCVPAVDAQTHQAWVFKTPHLQGKNRDNSCSLVNVCLSSAAAPIYFPLHHYNDPTTEFQKHYFVDGGLWANNPAVVGLIEALGMIKPGQPIEVISVGTADAPEIEPKSLKNTRWGLLKWLGGINIIKLSLSSQSHGFTNMAKILAENLTRLGHPVSFHRLDSVQKSHGQIKALGLDKPDSVSIDTLISCSRQDADYIHSSIMQSRTSPLHDIFTTIPELRN